ncbi:MAG: AAA family ATPase [Candidatus Thalassarchaeaceae archaeon]
MMDNDSECLMASGDARVSISVTDRILLHLWEQDHQADHYLVSYELTRPGIAEVCALHPPNVSRTMREIMNNGWVTEHTRVIRDEERRQKTWQLTEYGRKEAIARVSSLRSTKVILRDRNNALLEVRADEVASHLQANLTLLQVLMHAQHEGVLNFGDIRFGAIVKSKNIKKPGSITMLTGAHSTYHTKPPDIRTIHGRKTEKLNLDKWYSSNAPLLILSGIAGCGKTTLVSSWTNDILNHNNNSELMYYPCQPWDTTLGIAASLLHRLGIHSQQKSEDPYNVLDAIPFKPGGELNLDLYRRRLVAHLSNKEKLSISNFNEIIIILDDVHNIDSSSHNFFGMLLQVAEETQIRLIMISRTNLTFYDRRDVHTRNRVKELPLSGLSFEEISDWLDSFSISNKAPAEEIYEATGGHPLALELLELYGKTLHEDWLRFLDEEILNVMPADHRELLAILAVSDRPVPWPILASAANINGKPPKEILERGLMLELSEGMWIHEALRARLLRETGTPNELREKRLRDAINSNHMSI